MAEGTQPRPMYEAREPVSGGLAGELIVEKTGKQTNERSFR